MCLRAAVPLIRVAMASAVCKNHPREGRYQVFILQTKIDAEGRIESNLNPLKVTQIESERTNGRDLYYCICVCIVWENQFLILTN